MPIDRLKHDVPEYATDLADNLSHLVDECDLTAQQFWGAALASAIAARNAQLTSEISIEASSRLDPKAIRAVQSAAALMSMNDVYYRFTHHVGQGRYSKLPVGLKMSALGDIPVDRLDFELWSLAVSAVQGCQACMQAHEQALMQEGASREMVLNAVRIAAVIHGLAVTLEAERAVSADQFTISAG